MRIKVKTIHNISVYFIQIGNKIGFFFNYEGNYYGTEYDFKEDTRENFEKLVDEMVYWAKISIRKYKYKIKTTLKDIVNDKKFNIDIW